MKNHLLMALFVASAAFIQCRDTAQAQNSCAVTSKGRHVTVLVCRPSLSQSEWRDAGTAACADIASCSAWIWDDAAKAPGTAPDLATGLTQRQITSSVAIWDNDEKRLILIEKTKSQPKN